jgi:hypothetical protein
MGVWPVERSSESEDKAKRGPESNAVDSILLHSWCINTVNSKISGPIPREQKTQGGQMARPYWTGNLQISLVSFGVSLYVATESKSQISFHQISRKTGERIRHQKVLESAAESDEATTAVDKDEIVKGYEYKKGQYVVIEPAELENLRVPSKHTIAVSQFADANELDPEYVEKPYFVLPENASVGGTGANLGERLRKVREQFGADDGDRC